jgi:hypothetical protein
MIIISKPVQFTVMQLGPCDRAQLGNILDLANSVQRGFEFVFHRERIETSSRQYRLRNGAWDLDGAIRDTMARRNDLRRPIIFLTSLPYGDTETGSKEDWFYFAEYSVNGDKELAVISTHLWESLPGNRPLQPYLMLNLAAETLAYTADLPIHDETRGCVFDYCDEPSDIDRALKVKELCHGCEAHLSAALRSGPLTVTQLASARRLLNRAFGRNAAFIAMPFKKKGIDHVYSVIRRSLEDLGWHVIRADEIMQPRRITDAIIQAILSSDLVVADLTGDNPNVFYELGIAHAAGCDVLMLTQQKRLPFDVAVERAVFYSSSRRGLEKLQADLRRHISAVAKPTRMSNDRVKPSRPPKRTVRKVPDTLRETTP